MNNIKGQMKRVLAGILAAVMVLSTPMMSLAEEVSSFEPAQEIAYEESAESFTQKPDSASEVNESFTEDTTEEISDNSEEKHSEDTLNGDTTQLQENESATPSEDVGESNPVEEATPSEEEIAFDEKCTVDDVVITVTADKGVFPKGAKLKVSKVTNKKELKDIETAVEEVREEDKNVASSNTFDIQILNEKGNEIQPDNSKGTVNVKFSLAEKLNEVLDVAVYHVEEATPSQLEETETIEMDEEEILIDGELIDDVTEKAEENEEDKEKPAETPYKAEALETEITEKKKTTEVEVKTESFSVYVVEFTYGDLQYVLEGDTSVKLSEIQEKIDLPGEVTAASSSNADYFTITKDATGEDWTVTAKKAFDSEEKLTVKIGEKEFIIKVTDNNTITYFLPEDSWVPDGFPKNKVRNIRLWNVNDILTIQEEPSLKRHGTFYGPIDTKDMTEAYLRDSGTLEIYCQEGYKLRYASNASGMFKGFSSLRSYSLTRFFGIQDVVSLDYMFEGCTRLHSIYLNRELNDEISCAGILKGCDNLLVIGLGERFNKASELLPSDKKYYTNWPESGKKTYTNKTIEPGDVYVTDLSKAAPIQYGSGGVDWPDIAFTGETYDILSTEDIDMGCEPAKGYYNFIDNTNNPKTGKPYGTVYVEGQIVKQSSNMNEFELGWHTLTPVKLDEKHKYEITAVRNLPDTDEDVEEGYLPAEDITVKCEGKYPVNIDTLVWVARYTYDSEKQSYHITIEDEFAGEIICEKEIKPGDKTIEYTITYELNGGKNNTKNPSTYTITTADIKLQNPSRTGYAFAGWYSDSKLTKKATTTIKKGSTGNKTFYAKWTANSYTVKFNGNGSTSGSMSNQSRKYGDKKALTANEFKKTGYSFTGWNTKADGKGTAFANEATTNIRSTAGTTTLYAQWSKVKYKITYNLNGGTNNKSNPASYYVTTSTITLTNPTRTGYTFDGWYSDSKYKTKVTSIKKGSTGNKTLYAKWRATKYKITYNLNGGKNSSKNPAGYYITTADIKLQNPTKTGYTFGGWYSDSKYKTKVTTIKKGSTGNKTLYAKWTAKKYTITYNLDSGKNNSKNPETYTITTADIKLANPTRTGYVFGGWYSDSKFKTKVTTIKKGSTGNKTFYAKWTANKYTIAFNANGGSGSMSKMTGIAYGSSKTLTVNKFTRKNYTFQGWSTSKTGEVKYKNKASVKNLSSKNGATVTLYAIWKADTYTIAFNANGGSGSMSKLTVGVASSKALAANAFKKTGYTFAGWSTSKTGNVKYKNKATVKGLTTKGKTVTLYAVWTANKYTIAFNGNGSSSGSMKNLAATYDKKVTLTANAFKKKNYIFDGWNTKADGSGTSYKNKASVSNLSSKSGATVTLYAQWKAEKPPITVSVQNPSRTQFEYTDVFPTKWVSTVNIDKVDVIPNHTGENKNSISVTVTGTVIDIANNHKTGYACYCILYKKNGEEYTRLAPYFKDAYAGKAFESTVTFKDIIDGEYTIELTDADGYAGAY